jgi:deazaflavin-dependent oxidoreductase (nitroreductase family)
LSSACVSHACPRVHNTPYDHYDRLARLQHWCRRRLPREHYVVIASKGGSPTSPDWYHNLVANPRVIIEVGTERFSATARATSGEERERLYAAQAALMPGFAEYQKQTNRSIPVVVLERSPG